MNIPFTQKMFDLPAIREGESYRHLSSNLLHRETVGEALRRLQVAGWHLCRIIYPQIFYRLSLDLMLGGLPSLKNYKLRFLFQLEKDNCLEKATYRCIKSGFLYDSVEQLEQWGST